MLSHFWFDAPASRLSAFYTKQKAPVYLFSFDHVSENFYETDRAFLEHFWCFFYLSEQQGFF